MNDEAAFLAAIAASPKDELGYLVFADWLEEQGDPRGVWLRNRAIRAVMGPKAEHPMARIRQKLIEGNQPQQVQKAVLALGIDAVEGLLEMAEDKHISREAGRLLTELDAAKVPMPANMSERLLRIYESCESGSRHDLRDLLASLSSNSDTPPELVFDEDWRIRSRSMRVWRGERDDAWVMKRLEPYFRSEDPAVRCKSLCALELLSAEATCAILGEMLDDSDPAVVKRALEAHQVPGCMKSVLGAETIIRFLSSQDDEIVRLAAEILGTTRDRRFLRVLEQQLSIPRPRESRDRFLWAFGFCASGSPEGLETVSELIRNGPAADVDSLLLGVGNSSGRVPREFATSLITHVRRACHDADVELQYAMTCLGSMIPPPPETIRFFRELLGDDDSLAGHVCNSVESYLRGHGAVLLDDLEASFARRAIDGIPDAMAATGSEGLRRLAEMLPTASPERVRLILEALFRVRPGFRLTEAQSQAIFRYLYDMNGLSSRFARGVISLCRFDMVRLPNLTGLTRHLSGQDYVESLLGLGSEIVPHLPALEREMRTRAETSIPLQFVRVLEGLPRHPQAVLPCLRRMLADCGPGGALAHLDAIPPLIQAFGAMGPAARDDVPALLPYLRSDRDATRGKAVAALGRIGGHAGVVPALLACLGDAVPRNRRLATKALGDLKAREALGALMDRLADADRRTALTAMTALKRIGDLPAATVAALEAFRTHPDAEVRKRAAEAAVREDREEYRRLRNEGGAK